VAIFRHTFLNGVDPFYTKLEDVYRTHAKGLYQGDFLAYQEVTDRQKEEKLLAMDGFTDHRIIRCYQSLRYTAEGYAALLRTFSTHIALPTSFYEALTTAIDESGGTIVKPLRTTVWIAHAGR
jgi:hypothetical protein